MPLQLTELGPDLLCRILGLLPARTRAEVVGLVCKAFLALSRDPRVWEELEIRESRRPVDGVVRTRQLAWLAERGRLTRALSVVVPRDRLSLVPTPSLFALPACFPGLLSLDVARMHAFPAQAVQRLRAACPCLLAIEIRVHRPDAELAVEALCSYTALTRLGLATTEGHGALEALLAGLRGLRHLRHLSLQGIIVPFKQLIWPADLSGRLTELESLSLKSCSGPLPSTVNLLGRLSRLALTPANAWPAVPLVPHTVLAGLTALRSLSIEFLNSDGEEAGVPHDLQEASLWSQLTHLELGHKTLSRGLEGRAGEERCPGSLLADAGSIALPRLHHLQVLTDGCALRHCLRYGSMRALQSLSLDTGDRVLEGFQEARGLAGLTCLCLRGGNEHPSDSDTAFSVASTPPLEALLALGTLRKLVLVGMGLRALPPCLATARLTCLELVDNPGLTLSADSQRALAAMPLLEALKLCVCGVDLFTAAIRPASLQRLRAISGSLAACEECACHSEEWEAEMRREEAEEEDVEGHLNMLQAYVDA